MSKPKNSPETTKRKKELANTIKQLRINKYGTRGGPNLAKELGIPTRTWYNYEKGVTIPAEILLHFLDITGYTTEDLKPKDTDEDLYYEIWVMAQLQDSNSFTEFLKHKIILKDLKLQKHKLGTIYPGSPIPFKFNESKTRDKIKEHIKKMDISNDK